MSSQQITGGSSLRVEMKAHGRVRPLPETVEENLLRIAQEALTNVDQTFRRDADGNRSGLRP